MTRAERLRAGLAGALILGLAGAAGADLAPHALLDRLNEAVRQLDYEGRFVVQSGDRMDAMYIVHRASGGAENERVVTLTGTPREIIRNGQALCLVSGSDKRVNVGRRAHDRSFSPLRGVSAEELLGTYEMRLLEPGRVAGRSAHQILVAPRDDLRFGYRLFLDKESALPLRSMMLDADGRVISQMMFVELRVNEGITPIEKDLAVMELAKPDEMPPVSNVRLAPPAWDFGEIPPGFQMNVHRRRPLAAGDGEREHFIFSDGLASVSVYVQPAVDGSELAGLSQLGSARAVGRALDGHEVVVVGEVPVKTLEWFAQSIRAAAR